MVINISETQGDKKNGQKAIVHYDIDNFKRYYFFFFF